MRPREGNWLAQGQRLENVRAWTLAATTTTMANRFEPCHLLVPAPSVLYVLILLIHKITQETLLYLLLVLQTRKLRPRGVKSLSQGLLINGYKLRLEPRQSASRAHAFSQHTRCDSSLSLGPGPLPSIPPLRTLQQPTLFYSGVTVFKIPSLDIVSSCLQDYCSYFLWG